jgi:plastocyanin
MLNFLGRTSLTLSVVLVAAAMGLVYSGMRISGEAMVVTVSTGDNFFSPASLTVPAGSTVTWSNDGARPHTTTSDTGVWDSSMLSAGQTFSQVFASAGTFPYNCAFHPEMVATVVVEASAAAPTAVPQSTPAPAANNAAPPAAAPQAAPAPGAAAMPVGGGPPSIEGSSLAGAMILAGLGALLALAGTGALVAGARIENRRPA